MWCLYNHHCLDIIIIIRSSINCPRVICVPTVCYFLRETTSETYDPRVYFPIIYFQIYIAIFLFYLFASFIFRYIKPKIQKYLAAVYLFRGLFILSTTFISCYLPILRRHTRKGLTTPLTRRVSSICYLCACAVYVVWGGSPTGSITLVSSLREIPTVAILHHPFLFGEIPT